MEYKVITRVVSSEQLFDKEEFEKEVSAHLRDGYTLVGGISISRICINKVQYAQALTK